LASGSRGSGRDPLAAGSVDVIDATRPTSRTRPREALYALGPDPKNLAAKKITYVRHLTVDDQENIEAATVIFSWLTVESPFEDLRQTYHELTTTRDAQPERVTEAMRYGADVRRLFRHWLNDFRTFDDRTSARVSSTFGSDHPAYSSFKASLSAEYDANFAYRLAAALRNLSAHATNVLNHQMWHFSTDPDGTRQSRPVMAIHGPMLAASAPSLKASVARELEDADYFLDPRAITEATMFSCARAHASLVLDLWDEIEPEPDFVAGLHREALDAGGLGALFVNQEALDLQTARIDHRYNCMHLVEQAEAKHLDFARAASHLPRDQVTLEDLYLPGEDTATRPIRRCSSSQAYPSGTRSQAGPL
jgi:hypothetical protein